MELNNSTVNRDNCCESEIPYEYNQRVDEIYSLVTTVFLPSPNIGIDMSMKTFVPKPQIIFNYGILHNSASEMPFQKSALNKISDVESILTSYNNEPYTIDQIFLLSFSEHNWGPRLILFKMEES